MSRTNTKSVGRTVTTMTSIVLNARVMKYVAEVIRMMTHEKAIEWIESLKRRVHSGDNNYDINLIEALEMAINALNAKAKIINQIEDAKSKDKLCEYPYIRCIDIVKEVFGDDSKRID